MMEMPTAGVGFEISNKGFQYGRVLHEIRNKPQISSSFRYREESFVPKATKWCAKEEDAEHGIKKIFVLRSVRGALSSI